jgi:hypothetical protein
MNRIEINKLIEQMKNNINSFNYSPEILNKIENIMNTNEKYNQMILKIVIYKNNITYHNVYGDTRKNIIINMFNNMKKYIINSGKKLPNLIAYFYICDNFTHEYQDLPFFVLAKPQNRNGILFPDNTFFCHRLEKKCENWDIIKKKVTDKCNIEAIKDKINKIYFKGANTGEDKHNLRFMLSQEKKLPLTIKLSEKYTPMYSFCKYKYLLNLPGHQPWSYRFKYLFLMNSLVINVSVVKHYKDGEKLEKNDKWLNFFDVILVQDTDYIDIEYNWYENKDNLDEYNKYNLDEYNKLINKLDDVYKYYNSKPEEYKSIVASGFNKINNITYDFVLEMLYDLLVRYSYKLDSFIDKIIEK